MRSIILLVLLTFLVNCSAKHKKRQVNNCIPSPTTASGTKAPKQICQNQLIFEDNFDTLDIKSWKHENTLSGGGNWEFQWYTNNRSNSYTKDGILYIKPTLTTDIMGERDLYRKTISVDGGDKNSHCTDSRNYGCQRTGTASNILNPIRSAKITTVDSFSCRFCTVEFRAKMPGGDWLFPAVWMLPQDNAYGYWVASGEIDLVESRGNRNLKLDGKNLGVQQVSSTLHWGPSYEFDRYPQTNFVMQKDSGFDSDFNTYRMEWNTKSITFKINERTIGTVQTDSFWNYGNFPKTMMNPWRNSPNALAPFDQEFYFIINLAVGGISFFPDNAVNPKPKPWSNNSPRALTDFWKGKSDWLPTWKQDVDNGESAALQIDYIRVWAT